MDAISAMTKPILGTDEATIDDKGRILVAKKKRDRLGEPFVMAIGPVGCLTAYPEIVWNERLKAVFAKESINEGRDSFLREMCRYADDDLKFDAQGRVVIPQKLRELGKLKDRVLLVGCADRLEIWAEEEYIKFNERGDEYSRERREALNQYYRKMKE